MKNFFNKKLTFTVKEIFIEGILMTAMISTIIIYFLYNNIEYFANMFNKVWVGNIILWFVPAMIVISIVYNIAKYLLKKDLEDKK